MRVHHFTKTVFLSCIGPETMCQVKEGDYSDRSNDLQYSIESKLEHSMSLSLIFFHFVLARL